MPHRLRRVIGVNLFAPKKRGPSTLFAILDTRGAVIASGVNGVGKTSFLRLIPLFYGAQPSRVVRNSGHTSMIRHTLPDPTSAVVYEYERATSEDLRCAVMYCQANEDAPVFHIVKGGFDQRFFLADDGRFLARDEFKARAESLHVEVSQALSASQYRAVILNDRAQTKEMLRMKRLAMEHSLAPGSLAGLDHIAAAMGPESLSFGTLRDIVVSRTFARLGMDNKDSFELKKDLRSVDTWISHYTHLRNVQARSPDAPQLSKHCRDVAKLDLELRTLRAEARSLVSVTQQEGRRVSAELETASEAVQLEQVRLAAAVGTAKNALDEAEISVEEQERRVAKLEREQTRYNEMGAAQLDLEAQEEPSLLTSQASLQAQERQLGQASNQILEAHSAQLLEARGRLSKAEQQDREERSTVQSDHAQRVSALHDEERLQEGNVAEPPALQELKLQAQQLGQQIARLDTEMRNPLAPEGPQETLQKTRLRLKEAREFARAAQGPLASAQTEVRDAERSRNAKLQAHKDAEGRTADAAERLKGIEAQLTPASGSLLEFLRAANLPDTPAIAKVLDPALLDRTDLAPHDSEAPGQDALMTIGSLSLNVGAVQSGAWLDAADLRHQRAIALERLEIVGKKLSDAAADARASAERFAAAEEQLALRDHDQRQRGEAVQRLEILEAQHDSAVKQAVERRREEISASLEELRTTQEALASEQSRVEKGWRDARAAVAAAFKRKREAAQQELEAAIGRLDARLAQATKDHDDEVRTLDGVRDGKLSAAGVVGELGQLRDKLQGIGQRLAAISQHRHEVNGWRAFRDQSLPALASEQEVLGHRRAHHASLKADLSRAKQAQANHESESSARLTNLKRSLESIQADVEHLQGLLGRELLEYADTIATPEVPTWTVHQLANEVQKKRKEIYASEQAANALIASIRATITSSSGPAADWLTLREAEETSLAMAAHLETSRKGRLLCEWFETGFAGAVDSLYQDFYGMCGAAQDHVRLLETFERKIGDVNGELRGELRNVKRFSSFENLDVNIKSGVSELGYLKDLRTMSDIASSHVSRSRESDARRGRILDLPTKEEFELMRRFRDLLKDGGIRSGVSDLIKLACELTVEGKRLVITKEEEFRLHASNGNTGMIVAMFLMGFAGVVRRDARASARLSWITDELGRFDAANLHAFLKTLDENSIDVISAAPMTNAALMDMFDNSALFRANGAVLTAYCGEVAHAQA